MIPPFIFFAKNFSTLWLTTSTCYLTRLPFSVASRWKLELRKSPVFCALQRRAFLLDVLTGMKRLVIKNALKYRNILKLWLFNRQLFILFEEELFLFLVLIIATTTQTSGFLFKSQQCCSTRFFSNFSRRASPYRCRVWTNEGE